MNELIPTHVDRAVDDLFKSGTVVLPLASGYQITQEVNRVANDTGLENEETFKEDLAKRLTRLMFGVELISVFKLNWDNQDLNEKIEDQVTSLIKSGKTAIYATAYAIAFQMASEIAWGIKHSMLSGAR